MKSVTTTQADVFAIPSMLLVMKHYNIHVKIIASTRELPRVDISDFCNIL